MGIISAIEVALQLATGIVNTYTKNGVAGQLLTDATAAMDALAKVHGQEVTRQSLEGMRITPQW